MFSISKENNVVNKCFNKIIGQKEVAIGPYIGGHV